VIEEGIPLCVDLGCTLVKSDLLVEAARHGLPILCRDLPVFREVAGEHASYFSGLDAASLAQVMREWLAAHRRGAVPTTAKMPWLTWSESARQLVDVILENCPGTTSTSHPQGAECA